MSKLQLAPELIEEIRSMYETGKWTQQQLAERFEVTAYAIRQVVQGIVKPRPTVEERFWSKVDSGEPEACWRWTRGMNQSAYGKFTIDNETYRAHRVSYELSKGEIPPDQIVRHTCDHPWCVNPNHLVLGTHDDNVDDMYQRGRWYRGGSALKLTPVQALEAIFYRDIGVTYGRLAMYFSVSGDTIKRNISQDPLELRRRVLDEEESQSLSDVR